MRTSNNKIFIFTEESDSSTNLVMAYCYMLGKDVVRINKKMKSINMVNVDKKYFDSKKLIKRQSELPLFIRLLVKNPYNYMKLADNKGIKIITKYSYKLVSTL